MNTENNTGTNSSNEKIAASTNLVAPASVNQVTPVTLASGIEAEIALLKAKLAAAEHDKVELEKAAITQVQSKIEELPAQFGVSSLAEVVRIITHATGIFSHASKPRIPQSKLQQVKQALKNGASLTAVAKAFGISEASVFNYKARWGLTHRGGGVSSQHIINSIKSNTPVMSGFPPPKRGGYQLPLSSREGIVKALLSNNRTVKDIAGEFHTSRQTVYTMKNRLNQYRSLRKSEESREVRTAVMA